MINLPKPGINRQSAETNKCFEKGNRVFKRHMPFRCRMGTVVQISLANNACGRYESAPTTTLPTIQEQEGFYTRSPFAVEAVLRTVHLGQTHNPKPNKKTFVILLVLMS